MTAALAISTASLANTAMLVNLSISMWGARKFDKKISDEVADNHGTDKDAGRYNKVLIALDAVKRVEKKGSDARSFFYEQTLPWTDDGWRILPASNYWHFTDGMRQLKADFEVEVRNLLAAYPSLKTAAQLRLKTLYNEADYPTEDRIAAKYGFSTKVMPMPTSADFRVSLQTEEVQRLQQEIETRVHEAQVDAMRDLGIRIKKKVERMIDRLSNPDNVFKNSLIGNIEDLCELIPRLNMTDDPVLNAIRDDMAEKLIKYSPDTLRIDPHARKEVHDHAQEIMKKMSGFMGFGY